jgi:hypothetical protein
MPAKIGLDTLVKTPAKGGGEEYRKQAQFYFVKECGVGFKEFYDLPIPYVVEILEKQKELNDELNG